jgi:hypothetical protein
MTVGSLHARASKDQRPRAEVIANEPLNWSEVSNTKPVTHLDWEEIHHSMEAATRWIPALRYATGEIVADQVDEEAGIPYSCPAHHRHNHLNDDACWPNSNFRDTSTMPNAGLRFPPLPPQERQSEEAGTHRFPVIDDEDETEGNIC